MSSMIDPCATEVSYEPLKDRDSKKRDRPYGAAGALVTADIGKKERIEQSCRPLSVRCMQSSL